MPNTPTYYTLRLDSTGIERSLQAWGVLLDFEVFWQSKSRSTATLKTTENFDPVVNQWAFKQHATIFRDRQSATGADNSFSGGIIMFQGYFDDPAFESDTQGYQNIVYQLHNVWWLFERNPFKQYRMQFTGFNKNLQRIVAGSPVGGVNYKVGDLITPNGGTFTSQVIFAVAAVDAVTSGPTLLSITNGGGSYSQLPANPVATTTNSANGSGCTLNLVPAPLPILIKKVTSEIFLGEDLHTDQGYVELWPNGNGDQVGEVIDWVNRTYNPTWRDADAPADPTQNVCIKGTLDPHTKMPVTRVNTVFCAEAITNVLRWDPDAIVVIDDTTTPPTINVRKLGRWDYTTIPPTFKDYTNLPEVTRQITLQQEREILLQSQQKRQVPGVIIYYESLNTVDGVPFPGLFLDVFPNDGSITDWVPEVASHTVQLLGSQLTHVLADVRTDNTFVNLLTGNTALEAAWWIAHDTTLRDPNIKPSTITPIGAPTIVDDNGNPIDTTLYINELLSALPTWTNQVQIRAHVSQQISFQRYTDNTHVALETTTKTKVHNKTIRLTSAIGGIYSTTSSFSTAEVPPQNVAESVYRALAAQQYAGKIVFVDNPLAPVTFTDPANPGFAIGTRMKLIGPNHTFQNLMIQSVRQRPAKGETEITFGPGPLIDVDLWVELARATRLRITYNMPSNRGDGGSGGGGSSVNVDTGSDSPLEDTTHSVGGLGFHSVVSDFTPPEGP